MREKLFVEPNGIGFRTQDVDRQAIDPTTGEERQRFGERRGIVRLLGGIGHGAMAQRQDEAGRGIAIDRNA
ncbi:hypothetical protein, partial [Streptococcus pneumoniae]|uniref:hypothetical protein n=1 Tax=Streptococcus pneumoniae TaxID=1313 RepID=UPI0013DA35E9